MTALLFALAVLLLPSGMGAAAQSARPQVTVDEQSASPHFPDTVDFTLRAHGFEAYRLELNYRLVGDPVTAQTAVQLDTATSNISAATSLDLSTHYIPPGAQVAYYWTLTGDTDQAVTTPERTFTMADPRYNWQQISDDSKRVTVHWYEGGQAFGNSLVSTATGALDRLQEEIGARLERPASIYIYSTQDDLLNALPKNLPEWVGGKAFPELALILAAIAPGSGEEQEIKRIVPHEVSHLVLYQATRNPYNSPPAWMDEGLAVRNQEWDDPAEEAALKSAAEQGTLVSIKSLSGSFGADENVTTLSYGESRSVIDFVLSDPRYGPDKLARTISAFREGVTYDDALKAGLGITVDELDRQWRDWLPHKSSTEGGAATPASGGSIGSANPGPSSSTNHVIDFSSGWRAWLLFGGMGLCVALFLAGGVLTLFAVLRRKRA